MLRFQRDTVCFGLVTYLLVMSLGFGGWKLCVRNDGLLSLSPEYNQALKCKLYCFSHRGPVRTPSIDAKQAASCTCQACPCCFKVPLVMVPSSRGARLVQFPLTPSPELQCPWCQTISDLLYSGGCPPILLDSPLFHPSFESLRSTVLLI